MSAGRAHVLDRDVIRSDRGRLLTGGTPARMVRLSPAGAAALDRLLAGAPDRGGEGLGGHLRGRGLLHPVPGGELGAVSFVIPARDGGAGLAALVSRLTGWGPVLVVDDESGDGSADRAAAAGARVIANSHRPGPAGARNAGLAAIDTEFVAFIDADCACPRDWARPLAALLAEDPTLALVAPRVRGAPGAGALAAYERSRSPLDMGGDPGLVGPGRRIGFVPSAALVARRATLTGLGGFDEELRFGEDVDLVWRAAAAGWSVRYSPEIEVEHRARPSLPSWARQRFGYGASAAPLARRHRGAAAPLRVDRASGSVWLAALAGGLRAGIAAALIRTALSAARGRDRRAAAAIARLSVRGHLVAGRQLSRAIARDWLPATALAALFSPRIRRVALLAVAVDATSGAARQPRLLLPANLLLRGLENSAYTAGLWSAAIRRGAPGAILPTLIHRRKPAEPPTPPAGS